MLNIRSRDQFLRNRCTEHVLIFQIQYVTHLILPSNLPDTTFSTNYKPKTPHFLDSPVELKLYHATVGSLFFLNLSDAARKPLSA